jgi:hypothetical protein
VGWLAFAGPRKIQPNETRRAAATEIDRRTV